jgi:quinoprotein glucose dehydrogenase
MHGLEVTIWLFAVAEPAEGDGEHMRTQATLMLVVLWCAWAHGAIPEDARGRGAMPLYKVIPAAKNSELTPALHQGTGDYRSWSRSHADSANTRYSSLSQINRRNVRRLEAAWVYHSRDGKGNIQANPVVVGAVMYAPTVGRNIVAINAESGREIWRFHPSPIAVGRPLGEPEENKLAHGGPDAASQQELTEVGYGPAQRGLTYWEGDEGHGPRLFFVANGYLVALDPRTGTKIDSFGDHGEVSSSKGAGTSFFLGAVAPAVYADVIVVPNQNIVDAFDVVTGARRWVFNTLQYPVREPDEDNGGNVWGGMAMDTARGIAFISTGDPHPNFVGIDRPGSNPHTNSVLALDARTGRLLWSFQEVPHSLWDLDIPAAPNLVTVVRAGKRLDAVAQVTKLGNTLLLDRLTGKPIFPYRVRRAPFSLLPGEMTSTYQPDLQLPEPFARQVFTLDDITDITPAAHAFVLKQVNDANIGWFAAFEDGKPTVYYGERGGAEWPGAAFDPTSGTLYVSANEIPSIVTVSRHDAADLRNASLGTTAGGRIFQQHCAGCHGQNREGKGMAPSLIGLVQRLRESAAVDILNFGRGAMPPVPIRDEERPPLLDFIFERDRGSKVTPILEPGAPASYAANGFPKLLDERGYPGSKPPWGTLNAINLNTGKLQWKVPLGEYDELTRDGIPKTGMQNFGGATVTAGGLVFCAGTPDLKIRAFDKNDGQELWQYKLPYGGYAPPATYEVNGRQYVVIAATGGGKLGGERGDAYVAFALPK